MEPSAYGSIAEAGNALSEPSVPDCYALRVSGKLMGVKTGRLKYEEVETEMRQLAKTLPAGAKIPPERHLAITYQCNFLTVRKALKILVDEGIIVRRIGSGTFVADRSNKPRATPAPRARAKRIGLLVYHKSNAYAHRLLQGVAHAAMEEEIELRSCWVRNFREDGLRQAEALARDGCVAVVVPWFPHTMMEEVRDFVKRCPIPVSLPLVISGLEDNFFGEPARFGGDLLNLTECLCGYFRSLGRRSIAFIGPASAEDPILQKMLSAYTQYVSRHNLPNLAFLAEPNNGSMDQLAIKWKQYRGELGVVSYDDEHALRLMTAMHKIGLKAPDDYGVIGHNDTEASYYSDPPLTTVSQEFSVISRGLLRSAAALAEGNTYHVDGTEPLRLLVRGSCGGKGHIDEKLRAQMKDLVVELDSEEAER